MGAVYVYMLEDPTCWTFHIIEEATDSMWVYGSHFDTEAEAWIGAWAAMEEEMLYR